MSLTILPGIPGSIVAGDAVSFEVSDANHAAPVWSAQIVFKFGTATPITFNASDSGADHLFELSSANTSTLPVGANQVCLVFNDGANRVSGPWQTINILPDPLSASAQTFAQQQVALLQGAIAKLNASPRLSVTFNGQTYQQASIKDYQAQLAYWEARVASEQAGINGVATGGIRRIPIEFVNDRGVRQLP